MITRCKNCNKPLALNEEAWASKDGMYCSHECGVLDAMSLYTSEDEIANDEDLHSKAEAYFNDIAECISREDYGAYTRIWQTYSETDDITVVFLDVSENDTSISTTCVGWYHGEPDDESKRQYIGKLTAVYVD